MIQLYILSYSEKIFNFLAGIKSLKTLSMLMPYSRDIHNIIMLFMSLLTVVIVFNLILNCQYINECKNMTLTEHI